MASSRPHGAAALAPLLLLLVSSCTSGRREPDDEPIEWADWTFPREPAGSPFGAPASEPDEAEALPDLTAEGAGIDELLRYARRNNPGLAAAFERWRAAAEVSGRVTALPDPAFRFTGYLEEVETRIGPMQARVGFSQALPWFGTLSAAGRMADRQAAAALALLEAERWKLEERVRKAWYEMAWLEEAIAVAEGHRELLTYWESVARSRMEVGLGSHADVLRAQVELGKIQDRVESLTDLRRPLAAKLNAALGRPSEAPLPPPDRALPTPPAIDEQALLAHLTETSPELLALTERVHAAEEGIVLAEKSFYPNFTVGADYTFVGSAANPGTKGSGDDAFAVTIGLTLPIQRGAKRSRLRETEAALRAARHAVDEAANRLASALEESLYHLRDGDRRAELYRGGLIPKGEESLQSLDTGYQSGDEDFGDLIDAQRVLLEFQLQAVRAEADRAEALAETERLTGLRLHEDH
ncbi:MAG TPA: TolC family protein [Planctomycetes bacterium]|nr:TolC family protein [Planctomycetota bacterium]